MANIFTSYFPFIFFRDAEAKSAKMKLTSKQFL